ncbi:hypothetical protein B0F90DRAFT_1713364 [Multifurca ochricompacta]|uniref:DUF6535 domain-containing protein n=1 Tax=Multifurca ochricompacta TaxID=376703 RepID=A0AAD4QPJ1_9AGAM|nr:hypothetical protein B0F90DRAFT_1713364 [Multifurca ochricompacta]
MHTLYLTPCTSSDDRVMSAPESKPQAIANPFRESRIMALQASAAAKEQPGSSHSSNILGPAPADGEAPFTDSSSPLFSLYLSHAEKHDQEQSDRWKAGADGILVFTGLFSAALATLVVDSYKSLLPDSGSNTVALLTQISQQLNGSSQVVISSSPTAPQSTFQPTTSAVLVNVLWFLSLVITLFCALLATLQQHWARRYLRLTQPQCAVNKRARIRSYFAEGAARFHIDWAVEAIPSLLHISVFLFLAGLVISLWQIHLVVASAVLASTSVCVSVYVTITVIPVFCHDSPYHSPLSGFVWCIHRMISKAVLNGIQSTAIFLHKYSRPFAGSYFRSLTTKISSYKERLSEDMTSAAQKAARDEDWHIDARALSWTLDKLDEEREFEQFVAGIPAFMRSLEVQEPALVLKASRLSRTDTSLYREIMTLLIRASKPGLLRDSKSLPESVRQQRITTCLEALYLFPNAIEEILRRVSGVDNINNKKVRAGFASILESMESWLLAERLSVQNKRNSEAVMIGARCMATAIAARLRDTRELPILMQAFPVLMRQLNIKEPHLLNSFLQPFDSLLLKNLNNFLEETVLKFIHKDVQIFIWTIRLSNGFQLQNANQELRDHFHKLFVKLEHLADYSQPEMTVRGNARKVLFELACLRGHPQQSRTLPAMTVTVSTTMESTRASSLPYNFSSPRDLPPSQFYPRTPYSATFPLMPIHSPHGDSGP